VKVIELEQLAQDLGIDVIGAAPAEAYDETERHIAERRARGLFAGMRFTMARPEVSCHPETLLPNARTVVSAALCYYADEPVRAPGDGRSSARSSMRSAGGWEANTAYSSTRTTTSTAREPSAPGSGSTARTRC